MSIPDPLRRALEAAGYRIAETDRTAHADPATQPDHATQFDHASQIDRHRESWRVVDASGTEGLCTAVDVAGELDEDALATVADELTSGRHRHLIGLYDALIFPDAVTSTDRSRTRLGETATPEPASLALIWAVDSRSETLRQYRARAELTLAQISAVLVAASRALASLESLGLSIGPQWDLDDLILQDDGTLQRLAPSIVLEEAQSHTQLRQIARRGQDLLAGVGAEQCADLAHLLTATAFDDAPVSAGTFAALCYELVPPAAPDSWEPEPTGSADEDTTLSDNSVEPSGLDADLGRTDDAVAARYTQLSDTWRDHLRGAQAPGSTMLPGLRLIRGARSPKARHLQPPVRGKAWRRPSVIAGTVCVGLVAVLLGNRLYAESEQPVEAAHAVEHQVPDSHNGGRSPRAGGVPTQQEEDEPQAEGVDPKYLDPAAAALELTEERIRILQDLRTASGSASTEGSQKRLASVLVPTSPAMAADLELISQLEQSQLDHSHLEHSQLSSERIFAEARAAKTLEEHSESAVVEVSYDLVDPTAGRVAQTATLTLVMTDGTWRVNKVTGVPPIEPHL